MVYIALGNPPDGLTPGITIPMLLGRVVYQLFSGPISEEAGWRGFALPRLQSKYNALVSSLILGVIWTFWHLPLFFLAGSAQKGIPFPIYLVLICTLTLYITWVYNNTLWKPDYHNPGICLVQPNRSVYYRRDQPYATDDILYDHWPALLRVHTHHRLRIWTQIFFEEAGIRIAFPAGLSCPYRHYGTSCT
jgi:hypothetical protein